jgi:hypothetical protein
LRPERRVRYERTVTASTASADSPRPAWRADLLALTALAALFVILLHATWHRWGDIVSDCGREAYLAMRLVTGDVLYRDVASQYPPLAPYLNALLMRLFGVHLDVLYASGMVSSALVTLLTYRLCRRALAAPAAAATAGLLLFVCGFRSYLFDYILPPSYSGLYGLIFGLLAMLLLLRAWERRSMMPLMGAGLCCGLALVCKLESGLAAAAAGASFCVGRALEREHLDWRELARDGVWFGAGAALVVSLCAGWLVSQGVLGIAWFDNIFPAARVEYWNQRFYHVGFQSVGQVAEIVGDGAWFVVMTSSALALVGGMLLVLTRAVAVPAAAAITLLLGGAIAFEWPALLAPLARTGLTGLRWGPLGALACVLWALQRLRRTPASTQAPLTLLVGTFTIGMLARWGFVLHEYSREYSAPTVIVIAALLSAAIARRLLPRLAALVGAAAPPLVIAWAVALVIALHGYAIRGEILGLYEWREYPLRTPYGEIYTDADHGRAFERTLAFLAAQPPDAELLALPEEGFLNFLSGRRSRIYNSTVIPGMLLGRAEEEAFAAHLYADGPQFIIVSNRSFHEFGLENFATYNSFAKRWIDQNYLLTEYLSGGDYELQIYSRAAHTRPTVKSRR